MLLRVWPVVALALFTSVGLPTDSSARGAQVDALQALGGEWIYFEDRTEGRPMEQQGPPMSARFSLRMENDTAILVSGHGSGHRNVRIAFDGSHTDIPGAKEGAFARYRGAFEDGTFSYETEFVREPGKAPERLIRREFRVTQDGLLVRVSIGAPVKYQAVAIYRHAQDIPMPNPVKAEIDDLAWLAGAWVGTRGSAGTTSIEERWAPPLGDAMLAISRTVSREKMSSFEYLRIIERESELVYIAQPGGGAPTEFVATELTTTRVVFDNPRHDYPKRIVYDLSADGALNVSIGFTKGGSPRRFQFKREVR